MVHQVADVIKGRVLSGFLKLLHPYCVGFRSQVCPFKVVKIVSSFSERGTGAVPACQALAPVPFLRSKMSFPETSGERVLMPHCPALGRMASWVTRSLGSHQVTRENGGGNGMAVG